MQELPDFGFYPQYVSLTSGGKDNTAAGTGGGFALSMGQFDGLTTGAWLATHPVNTTNADQRQNNDYAIMLGTSNATISSSIQ